MVRTSRVSQKSGLPRVVIVGGGFGGLEVAKALKNAPVQVVVIDSRNHFLFQPLLYQVATAGLSPSDIAVPIRSVLKSPNTEVVLEEVLGVDIENKKVLTNHEPVPYDYLVLATGARHGYFGHNEWEQFAPGLKSISDATSIRRNILLAFEGAELETDSEKRKALLNFVVIGGGPTGVELSGAISELANRALASDFRHVDPTSARVILIEAGSRVLAAFPEDLSQKAREALEKKGVEVRTGFRVMKVDADGVSTDNEKIPTKTVIWAAGVVASPAAQWLKAPMDKAGRVIVNPDLTVGAHPSIFAIGDTASLTIDGKPLPGVSPVAMQQGRYVARLINKKLTGPAPHEPFRYFDKGSMATIGRSRAVAFIGKLHLSGFLAWLAWLVVHIYYLIGFRNRILVLIQWAYAYLTFKPGARLIVTADKSKPAE